ncbi:MAG: hypothetical protein WBM35_16900 [Candidatus Electrothrix sp.]
MALCSFGEGGSSTAYQEGARLPGKRGRGEGGRTACAYWVAEVLRCWVSPAAQGLTV